MKCTVNNKIMAKRGIELPQSKLDENDVRLIRELKGQLTAKSLAEKFDVHYRTIEKVLSYETWVHVL